MNVNILAPRTFHLQWHITEKCNLKCKHCYRDPKYLKNELKGDEFFKIFYQYLELLKIWKIPRMYTHLSLTGGEPLLKKEFFPLLEKCYENKNLFRYNVMTNGTLINKKVAKKFKELEVRNVQLSIEGMEKINDEIRGKGTFKKIIKAAKILKNENINVSFSLTVSKKNLNDIPEVIELCLDSDINILGIGRLVPIGKGEKMKNLLLTPLELKNLYKYIQRKNEELKKKRKKLIILTGCSNSLWTTEDPNFITHGCSLGYDCLTPMPNGDVLPCRRVPIKVGNIKEKTLLEIWYDSNILWEMRNLNNLNKICQNCEYFNQCYGGARCVAYGYYGNIFAPDPQCWIKIKEITQYRKNNNIISNKLKLNEKFLKNIRKEEKIEFINKASSNFIEISPKELKIENLPKESKTIFLSFNLTKEDLNINTGNKIIKFLNELKKRNVTFKITKPLPRCMFGNKYMKVINEFKIPKSCKECLELFSINKKGDIIFCKYLKKIGPKLKYMKNREFIYSYFKILYEKAQPTSKCKTCIYFLRGDCNGLCFRYKS